MRNIRVRPIVVEALLTVTKGLEKRQKEFWNQKKNRDDPHHCIVKIGKNTEKSPGDVRKIAVTQTLVKYYQLMLM